MDRLSLEDYVHKSLDAFKTLNEIEPEEDMYRLGIMHMNILAGEYSKVEQEFQRIEADVDKETMGKPQLCYYNYLRAMMLKDDEVTEKTAHVIRRNYRTQEPKMFYFWLLLFVDATYNEDKSALYRELSQMFDEGENSPIIYFELCNLFNANPMLLKKLTEYEITAIKWGLRHKFISDEVLLEFVKLAGKNKEGEMHDHGKHNYYFIHHCSGYFCNHRFCKAFPGRGRLLWRFFQKAKKKTLKK